jgi:uncharacterized repeat protein (TIGR01451 family)
VIKLLKTRKLFLVLASLCFLCFSISIFAQTPLAIRESYNGRYELLSTGGTLRSNPNNVNACSTVSSSTANLSGLPASATVTKAYLYWAGSGQTPDNTVTFDGTSYNADRTFSTVFNSGTNNFYFFGGVKDITTKVQARRNTSYTFTNLTFQNTDSTNQPYCSQQGVVGGWGLYVIYQDNSLVPKRVNLYEGFELFRNSTRTFTLNGLNVPPSPQGIMSVLTWEGDPSLSGGGEDLLFNGISQTDALNPSGNAYNSTINLLNNSASHGVDLDTYNIGSYISPGDTTASAVVTTGTDLVILNVVALSASTTVADLELSQISSTALAAEGQPVSFTLSLFNRGPNPSSGSQVRDLLPAGLTFVSATPASGTYNSTTGIWDIPALAVNATTTITINAVVNSGTAGTTLSNPAEVIFASNFDPDSSQNNGVTTEDDYASQTLTVKPNADLTIVKTAPATASLGQVINYSIQVSNVGSNNVNGLTISDAVPAGVTVTNWTCAVVGNATCGIASGTTNNINLTGNINAGAANKININVTGTVNAAATITNIATVTLPSNLNDPTPLNNTSTAVTNVTVEISGTIWQDVNGSANGTFTGIQNGSETGTNAGGLFVIAVSSTGTIISTASVNATGTYTITGVLPNTANLSLRIATTTAANGQPAPTANLPIGWTNTSPLFTAAFSTVTSNITGRDFGIERLPTANGLTSASLPNPSSTITAPVPSAIFTGNDPDGTIIRFTIISFPTNSTTVTIGGVSYTAGTFPVVGVSVNALPDGSFPLNTINVDPIDGVVNVGFVFSVTDNAQKTSLLTSIAIQPFGTSLPPSVLLVKTCSAPANCETANQLPGTDLTYTIQYTNSGGQSAQGFILIDAIPANTDFKISSPTSVAPSGLNFVVEYSYDYLSTTPNAATWTNAPPANNGGGATTGYNALVKAIRWRSISGSLSNANPNNTGTVSFIVKIR